MPWVSSEPTPPVQPVTEGGKTLIWTVPPLGITIPMLGVRVACVDMENAGTLAPVVVFPQSNWRAPLIGVGVDSSTRLPLLVDPSLQVLVIGDGAAGMVIAGKVWVISNDTA